MVTVLRWWNLICLCLQMSGEAAMSLVCSCAFFASNIEKKKEKAESYVYVYGWLSEG